MAKNSELSGRYIWRKRPEDQWLWRVKVNSRVQGGPTGTHNKREAEAFAKAKHEELNHEARQNAKVGLGPLSFDLACQKWIDDVGPHIAGFQIATVQWIRAKAAKLYGVNLTCQDLRDEHVMAVRKLRQKCLVPHTDRQIAPATVNGTLALFQWVLSHAHKNYSAALAPINWEAKKLPIEDREIRILEDNEMIRVLGALRADMHDVLVFALASGKRIDEILSLTWSQIRWQSHEMMLRLKGSSKLRDPLGEIEIAVLERQLQARGLSVVDGIVQDRAGNDMGEEPVFTFVAKVSRPYYHNKTKQLVRYQHAGRRYPLLYGHLEENLKQVRAKLKIKGLTIHVLRHTAATLVLRKDGEGGIPRAMRMLGHTNPVTTMKFYAKVMNEDVRRSKNAVVPDILAMLAPRAQPPVKLIAAR